MRVGAGSQFLSFLELYPGRIAVMGNISIDLLARGSVEEVVAEVRRTLKEVSAFGPHSMSSANTITSWVRPEIYLALVNTTRQFGQYPIA